jgi:hypothetical protein
MTYIKYVVVIFCAVLLFTQAGCQPQKVDKKAEMPETASLPDESEIKDNKEAAHTESKGKEEEEADAINFSGKYITAFLPQGFKIIEKEDGAGTPGQNISYLSGGVEYKGLTQITIIDPAGVDIVKIMAAYNTIDPSSITVPSEYNFVKDLSFTADGVKQNTYVVMEWFEDVAPETKDQLKNIVSSIKVK